MHEEDDEERGTSWLPLIAGGAISLLLAIALVVFLVLPRLTDSQTSGVTTTHIEATAIDVGDPDAVGADDDAVTWKDTGLQQPPLKWPDPKSRSPGHNGRGGGGAKRPAHNDRQLQKRVRFTVSKGTAAGQVFIDGRRRGSTPLTLMLDAGRYELRFEGGERSVLKTVDIGMFSADEYEFNEGMREIKTKFN